MGRPVLGVDTAGKLGAEVVPGDPVGLDTDTAGGLGGVRSHPGSGVGFGDSGVGDGGFICHGNSWGVNSPNVGVGLILVWFLIAFLADSHLGWYLV